jgi:hypothetical protein
MDNAVQNDRLVSWHVGHQRVPAVFFRYGGVTRCHLKAEEYADDQCLEPIAEAWYQPRVLSQGRRRQSHEIFQEQGNDYGAFDCKGRGVEGCYLRIHGEYRGFCCQDGHEVVCRDPQMQDRLQKTCLGVRPRFGGVLARSLLQPAAQHLQDRGERLSHYPHEGLMQRQQKMLGFHVAGAAPTSIDHFGRKFETVTTAIRIDNPSNREGG